MFLDELFLYQAESGGSGIVTRRFTGQAGSDEFVMKIPNNKVWKGDVYKLMLCTVFYVIGVFFIEDKFFSGLFGGSYGLFCESSGWPYNW